MTMKIYVWEGNGISASYHNDGTLVVLAESPAQAREIVRAGVVAIAKEDKPVWAQEFTEYFDGDPTALDREPDRVVEIDAPAWVAFNGGGYD